jgi:hypothetical protein
MCDAVQAHIKEVVTYVRERRGSRNCTSRLKNWLVSCETKLDFWPQFKLGLAEHEWVIYPFFVLLVVIFFLLLPRAARFP